MEKELLHALHPVDVRCFLESHGLLQDIKAGRVRCIGCSENVTVDTFGAVTRLRNELKFACSKESCLLALMDAVAIGAAAPLAAAVTGGR